MSGVIIQLPEQTIQDAFNVHRWNELLEDDALARIEGRIETDRFGNIIMSPPPGVVHGSYQSEIAYLLRTLLPEGRVLTECPISTADGVRAADVAWASPQVLKELGNRSCFPKAPEICVEVLSPRNTAAEMRDKMALYFDAGAQEVWTCSATGEMKFYYGAGPQELKQSRLLPAFPPRVELQ